MPAPATKAPFELVQWSDLDALGTYAGSLGLAAAAGSVWDYTFESTNWLTAPDASPGPINRIRRDLRVALEEIDEVFGSRGWPEACVCSGPWVLPPESYTSPVPGTDWPGVATGAAGAYAQLKSVQVIAAEEIVGLYGRGDVNFNGLVAWNGAAYVPDRGWTGTWSSGLGGWTALSFECGIAPAADVTGYQGGADGYVWITLAGSGADVAATVNGSAATIAAVLVDGAYQYRADVTGLSAVSGLEVVFAWTVGTHGVASDFGCYFSVLKAYGAGSSYAAALAESPQRAQASPDLRVTAGTGWQIADTWVWPEFNFDEETNPVGDEIWAVVATTLPVQSVAHQDYVGPDRLAPQHAVGAAYGYNDGGWPEAPSAPMQRADLAEGDRDGLDDTTRPSLIPTTEGPVPTTPPVVPCYSIAGVWAVRGGKLGYMHAPFLADVPAEDETREPAGAEVSLEVGMWRGGDWDASWGGGLGLWTGGEFAAVETVTIPETTAFLFVPFAVPWPTLANKAVVWQADPDVVTVTALVVTRVWLPTGGDGGATDWDASWPGQTSAGIADDGGTADDFPARPDDAGDAWVDFPPNAWRECPPVAWWNDTLALLAAFEALGA
jgi:hypothetical protein